MPGAQGMDRRNNAVVRHMDTEAENCCYDGMMAAV